MTLHFYIKLNIKFLINSLVLINTLIIGFTGELRYTLGQAL